jgi:hypothetical protein
VAQGFGAALSGPKSQVVTENFETAVFEYPSAFLPKLELNHQSTHFDSSDRP